MAAEMDNTADDVAFAVHEEVVPQREVTDRDEAAAVEGHEEDHEVVPVVPEVLEAEAAVDTDPIYIQVEAPALWAENEVAHNQTRRPWPAAPGQVCHRRQVQTFELELQQPWQYLHHLPFPIPLLLLLLMTPHPRQALATMTALPCLVHELLPQRGPREDTPPSDAVGGVFGRWHRWHGSVCR